MSALLQVLVRAPHRTAALAWPVAAVVNTRTQALWFTDGVWINGKRPHIRNEHCPPTSMQYRSCPRRTNAAKQRTETSSLWLSYGANTADDLSSHEA